jgi:metal-dependent amidase/aminoacylase/carboxypeptidase family protein
VTTTQTNGHITMGTDVDMARSPGRIRATHAEMIAWRRDIHADPELGFDRL